MPADQPDALNQMLQCLMHERFYGCGNMFNEGFGLAVGWACLQGGFSDCLPVWNETRDVCLIFSGEDFADPRLLEDLKSKGHAFDPGNASYLVHLYEELGLPFL
jgi:hypothetical protein